MPKKESALKFEADSAEEKSLSDKATMMLALAASGVLLFAASASHGRCPAAGCSPSASQSELASIERTCEREAINCTIFCIRSTKRTHFA